MDSRIAEPKRDTPLDLEPAFPEGFPFYHLGQVRIAPSPPELGVDSVAIAFKLAGDLRGALLVRFDRGLDPSLYSEMANVLASRFVTNLSRERGWDVMISPPDAQTYSDPRSLAELLRVRAPRSKKTYLHLHEQQSVPVELLVFAQEAPEESAHA